MKFNVAIPTYNRSNVISEYALKTLIEKNVKPEQINLFVANEEEYNSYKSSVDDNLYNEIIIGKIGKNNQINFIRNFYNNGNKVLNLDDDVYKVDYLYNGKLEPVHDLYSYSRFIFKLLKKYKCGLAGTYYPHNPFFMKHKIDIGYYNIVGTLYWTINNNTPKLNLFLERGCEDLEFSIKNFNLYKKVMRTREVVVFDKSNFTSELERGYNDTVMKMTHKKMVKKYPNLIEEYVDSKGRVLVKHKKQKDNDVINLKERRL